MLGLCELLGGFVTTSNRESGDGRYDIQLKPAKKSLAGILIELKAEKNCNEEYLKKLSETALQFRTKLDEMRGEYSSFIIKW